MSILDRDRAWIEINLDNLEHNIKEIKKVMQEGSEIMAVVKANAYGHGSVMIAKKLNEIGIYNFAVATLQEGIELRKNQIEGDILILGYTNFEDIEYVTKYNLIQTIIDYKYASIINNMELEHKIRVHIAMNTGMNRIGEDFSNMDKIIEIYRMKNLLVEGIFTHLCVADSNAEEDILFTKGQVQKFYNVIEQIEKNGINVGKKHIQSSYGLLNYPEIKCDFVRTGIIMYGVYSSKNEVIKTKLDLKPVLSLKARITSVREINEGDSISYGRTFKSNSKLKIASVSIGYADGYPRNLSNKDAKVFVNGKKASVLGRICMDQLVIDVSDVDKIEVGDIVELIGEKEKISAESIADKSETITYELLSRLGSRLERVVCGRKKCQD